METFKSYANTKNELKILEYRYEILNERKLELETIFLGIRTAPIDEIMQSHTPSNKSRVISYLYEYEEKKQKNGYSIKEEMEILEKEINRLKLSLAKMEKAIKKVEGIEYLLFYYIFVENCNPRKAVEKVAEISEKAPSTVWRHYAKIKEEMK